MTSYLILDGVGTWVGCGFQGLIKFVHAIMLFWCKLWKDRQREGVCCARLTRNTRQKGYRAIRKMDG
jgi:hypothetical protein